MTKHYNPSITERAARILNSKAGDYLSDNVQGPVAVIPLLPITRIVRGSGMTNATTSSLYTTPAEEDFYLTNATLSVDKDVTSPCVATDLRVSVDGVAQTPLRISGITLRPSQQTVSVNFNPPIKIDRNTSISINASSATANIRVDGAICGYIEAVKKT